MPKKKDTSTTAQPAKQPKKPVKSAKPTKAKPNHPKATITFRNNILPPLIGIIAFLEVLAILNLQWLVAQYQYHFTKPAYVAMTTEASNTDPNAPARIYIPNIDVDAPLVTGNNTYDAAKVQKLLQGGPVQYGASVNPGEIGNLVVIGHSSGQLWAPGDYKFVFTLLDKLEEKDRIFVDYKGKRYIYRVTDTKVVPPTDISVLHQTDEPILTLVTCTPVGTSTNRLVVTAEQVSPNPETAKAPAQAIEVTSTALPN